MDLLTSTYLGLAKGICASNMLMFGGGDNLRPGLDVKIKCGTERTEQIFGKV